MKTKTYPSRQVKYEWAMNEFWGSVYPNYRTYSTGTSTITYGEGRKVNGHWPWKPCYHTCNNYVVSAVAGSGSRSLEYPYGTMKSTWTDVDIASPGSISDPGWDESILQGITNQLDLNKGESVLLYSGVIQAVPLVGGVLKLSSILNKAARNLSKSFKRKPFTTVVKSLISLDFIDRFVVSPMLDDARKFQDAVDYALRVIQTARERSAHSFALSSERNATLKESVSTYATRTTSISPYTVYEVKTTSSIADKAFALLEARYDLDAVTPMKIWARRVGLTRPLDSVWDLVPFSFVIDYFTRAGDFISALSDEMSDVEGMKGTITKIHGLWGSHLVRSERRVKPVSWTWDEQTGNVKDTKVFIPGQSITRNEIYSRFEVPNPYLHLIPFSETIGDYLTVNLDLSQTRKRTIAELIIQAKL